MRSRTSYFNRTLFLKTAARFWPLWFIYAAVWFVAMPLLISSSLSGNGTMRAMQANVCASAGIVGIIINMLSACMAVMAAWSFMYSHRSASGMACLPIRREGVFLSVSLGGLAPLLLVNVLIFLLSLGVQELYGRVDPGILGQWLGAVSLELVFFYGFALACAQLTGNLAVLPLVYLVLNFAVYVVMQIISTIMSFFVYGSYGGFWYEPLLTLSPPLYMMQHFSTEAHQQLNAASGYYETVSYSLAGWGTLAAYAAAGLVLAGLALWLYRRRRMESAGDVVAVGVLKPVFKYCMTFGCALCIGSLLYGMVTGGGLNSGLNYMLGWTGPRWFGMEKAQWGPMAVMLAFMLIGAFIGYFASEMLIHKSFRVWRGRWLGIGVSAAVIVALMVSVELDLFGYERRVPDAERVESVTISTNGYYNASSHYNTGGVELYEPENIAAAVELHKSIVEHKSWYEGCEWRGEGNYDTDDTERYINLRIEYTLKNGGHISRAYSELGFYLYGPSTQTDVLAAQALMNTPEAIACRKQTAVELNADTVFSATVDSRILPEDAEKAAETGELIVNGEKMGIDAYYDYAAAVAEAEVGFDDYSIKVNGADGVRGLTAEEAESLYCTGVWQLTPEEAAELYNECILPDMADGTIGTIWLVAGEEYENTVYGVQISIDMRRPSKTTALMAGPSYDYDYFYTVPTVNSVRTNRWLEDHGVVLRTIAEAGEL